MIILLTILSVSSVYGEEIQNIESKDNISTVEIEKDFQELKSKINTLDENISEIDYKQYVKRLENLEWKYIDVTATSQTVNLWITILLVVLSLVVWWTFIQNRNFDKQAKKELKEITDAKEKALEKISNLDNIVDKKIEEISNKAKEVHLEIISEAEKQRKINDFFNIWGSLCEDKKYKEAIERYDKVLEIDKDNPRALRNKWSLLGTLWEVEEAINLFNKSLEIDNKNIDAISNKWLGLTLLWKQEDANKLFDQILKKDNKNTNDIYLLGRIYSLSDNMLESIESLQKIYNLGYFEDRGHRKDFYKDNGFDSISDTKEFKEFVQKVKDKYWDE